MAGKLARGTGNDERPLPSSVFRRAADSTVGENPAHHLPEPEELAAALTPHTRVFCTTWVHSFSGVACELHAPGAACRANGTWLVVAVLGVGFKWLCGPYGTGFLRARPELLRSLNATQAYWLAQMTADDLG